MKKSNNEFKNQFMKLKKETKITIIAAFAAMISINLVNLSFLLCV